MIYPNDASELAQKIVAEISATEIEVKSRQYYEELAAEALKETNFEGDKYSISLVADLIQGGMRSKLNTSEIQS